MHKLRLAALAFLLATTVASAAPAGRVLPLPYRDLFNEYLGENDAAVDAKIDAAWRQLFYGNDATQRVYYPVGKDMAYIYDTGNNDARTEGMSYGMMIAVQLGHKEEFDRLWKWAKTYMYHANGPLKGYFAWHCRCDGTVLNPGPASDGEEWFATALFFAAGRWGNGKGIFNYEAEANAILETMRSKGDTGQGPTRIVNMFDEAEKQVRFIPYPDWKNVTDPSYQLPAFYEVWGLWARHDNAFWRDAATASRAFFRRAANPATGLMPDYAYMDGRPCGHNGGDKFGGDAHRIFSNVALDECWFGKDPWETEQSERVLKFLTPYRGHIPSSFSLDGKPLTNETAESVSVMAATAALAADRKTGEPFVRDLWNMPIPSGRYRYYNGMLYLLALMETGGRFHAYAPVTGPSGEGVPSTDAKPSTSPR